MAGSEMVGASIEAWTWRSRAVLAASLSSDGVITRANLAFERLGGHAGLPLAALVEPSQHAALARRLAAADDSWHEGTFAFRSSPGRPAQDRRLWFAQAGGELLVVGEPLVDEQERLVEKVLELNDELVGTHRELVRERAAAEAGATRVQHLEAVASAGLAGRDLQAVLVDVLRVIRTAVSADSAAIVLREDDGELVVRAVEGAALDEGLAAEIVADGRPRIAPGGLAGVPLMLEGGVLGALEVQGSSFSESDLRLLVPAAERAALAIARAQVLERERGIAETLQRALLPDRLPSVAGLELTAHFEPAAGAVGGDWYDAVRLDSGELALVIGDVAGKGIPAAALMGELRGGLRAAVLDGGEPHEVLRRLDRLADRAGHMATVLVVLLDPQTGALRHASAGHLPALVIEPGGASHFLWDGTSTPLLAYDADTASSGTSTLPPGGRLLLYTDGLVERRGEAIDEGLARLARSAAAPVALADLPAHVLSELLPPRGGLRDDIALLTVERTR